MKQGLLLFGITLLLLIVASLLTVIRYLFTGRVCYRGSCSRGSCSEKQGSCDLCSK